MPITPFHLGPGAAFKAIGGRHFSFMVFGGSQVVMDIEPAVQLFRGADVLHGYTHTLAGALVIGAVATIIGRPISHFALGRFTTRYRPFSWAASATGAFVGTFSHILFDGFMHADMRPFWPLVDGNPMLGLVAMDTLHLACVVLGILGGLAVWVRSTRDNR
jgi:membrane-bound metal-dependent hydrolase YbcI (DUF457 family)